MYKKIHEHFDEIFRFILAADGLLRLERERLQFYYYLTDNNKMIPRSKNTCIPIQILGAIQLFNVERKFRYEVHLEY